MTPSLKMCWSEKSSSFFFLPQNIICLLFSERNVICIFFANKYHFVFCGGRKRVYSKKALMTSLKKMARINMLSGSSLWGGSSAQINTKQTSGLFLKVWWRSSFGCSSLLSFCNSNCFRHKVNKKITFSFSSWGHPEGSVAYHLELRWIVKSAVSLISSCTKLSKRTFFHYETWKSGEISNAVVVISLFNECSLVYKISYKTNLYAKFFPLYF